MSAKRTDFRWRAARSLRGMDAGSSVHGSCPGRATCGRLHEIMDTAGNVLVYQGFLDVRDGKVIGQCVGHNTAAHFKGLVRKVMRTPFDAR